MVKGKSNPRKCDFENSRPKSDVFTRLVTTLESVKRQIEAFNDVHEHNYFPGTLKEIEKALQEARRIK